MSGGFTVNRNIHNSSRNTTQIYIYHLLRHDTQEVSEGDLPCSIFIHLTNHLLDLLFLGFKAQSSHGNLAEWTAQRS